jgi:hypothetical protein
MISKEQIALNEKEGGKTRLKNTMNNIKKNVCTCNEFFHSIKENPNL